MLIVLSWLISPFFVGLTFFIIVLSFLLKTPLGSRLGIGMGTGLLILKISTIPVKILFFPRAGALKIVLWQLRRRCRTTVS
jgi:hypothetical protein